MSDQPVRIFIVEDEHRIARFLQIELEHEGFETATEDNGQRAFERIGQERFDLVLLDVMLPGIDGYEVCRAMRAEGYQAGVIMLTARTQEADKVNGLMNGADDYVTKPFNPSELVARVKSQLRRYTQLGAMEKTASQIVIRGLVLDTESKSVTVDGEAVRLTPLEYKILELLCRHPGKVFSTEEIYRQVWNDDIVSDNAIAVHVRHIREKIEINPKEPRYLKVVWGVGYKIERSE